MNNIPVRSGTLSGTRPLVKSSRHDIGEYVVAIITIVVREDNNTQMHLILCHLCKKSVDLHELET